jgi:hypothetical protein
LANLLGLNTALNVALARKPCQDADSEVSRLRTKSGDFAVRRDLFLAAYSKK